MCAYAMRMRSVKALRRAEAPPRGFYTVCNIDSLMSQAVNDTYKDKKIILVILSSCRPLM